MKRCQQEYSLWVPKYKKATDRRSFLSAERWKKAKALSVTIAET